MDNKTQWQKNLNKLLDITGCRDSDDLLRSFGIEEIKNQRRVSAS